MWLGSAREERVGGIFLILHVPFWKRNSRKDQQRFQSCLVPSSNEIEREAEKHVHTKTTVGSSAKPLHAARNDNIQRPLRTADSTTTLHRDDIHDSMASMDARPANSEMGMPFTEAELTLALTRTSLRS